MSAQARPPRLLAAWAWLTHDFFKASAMLLGLTLVGSLLNMLARRVLGQMLTSEQYGEMEAMMQVSAMASVPLAAIQTVVARETAASKGLGRPDRIGAVVWAVGRQLGLYAILAMLLLFAAAPFLREFLRLNSVWPVFATGAVLLSVFLISITSGALQGGHRFWQAGAAGLLGPVARIGLSWALIRPGFGATGALAAHAGSALVISLAGLAFVWDLVKKRSREAVDLRPMYRFVWPTMAALALASVLGGLDIIIVKRLFSTWVAGDYARVSAVVRLSLFVNGALTMALFPWVAAEQVGGRRTGHLLGKALLAGAGIAVLAALFFTVFPGFSLRVFYPEATPDMRLWVKLMGWALIPGSLFNILVQYHMARQEYRFLYWLVPAGGAYAGLLILCGGSIPGLIAAMGGGTLVVCAGLALPVFASREAA